MLKLPDLSGKVPVKTKTFLRSIVPHIALVLVVSVYLLFGAEVFCLLERRHDQLARVSAKVRLNREINRLTAMIYGEWYDDFNVTRADVDDNSTVTAANELGPSPDRVISTTMTGNEHQPAGVKSSMKDDPESLYRRQREVEKRIYELLHRWEDAIRGYDIRTSHMFTEEYMIDRRWETEVINEDQLSATQSRWTFSASVLFAFTVISTIGYGNLTPSTFWGRLFCMIYGLIGIPMTMLAIANIGRFLWDGVSMLVDRVRREREYHRLKKKVALQQRRKSRIAGQYFKEIVQRSDIELKPLPKTWGHVTLFSFFVFYVIVGALCLPLWEDMDFFDGCYFSFVTVTTVGFGDIVPRRYDYLFPTLVYITVGLAITTITIEIFGAFLREIHYLGSKIKGAKNVWIWFGNKMLTVQELVTAVGRQYGIPQGEIETLNENLDQVVTETVQHKREELRLQKMAARRKKSTARGGLAPLFADYEFRYIDEESANGTPLYKGNFALPKRSV